MTCPGVPRLSFYGSLDKLQPSHNPDKDKRKRMDKDVILFYRLLYTYCSLTVQKAHVKFTVLVICTHSFPDPKNKIMDDGTERIIF